jgi:hypothetical protein
MGKRTRGISEFAFLPMHESKHMHVIISVGGWLAKTDEKNEDIALPYSILEDGYGDHYSLLWEPEMLRELGSALKMFASEVITTAVQQALMVTMLHSLMAALAWPLALTKIGYLIDNPWQNALARSKKAGQLLADLLVQHIQEGRPVTLIGYSLGARVLFYTLLELARNHAYGIVENVYLFGNPVTPSAEQWRLARTVASGRFVNGYVRNDWVLGFLFRATTGGFRSVAGLSAAECPGIDDIDLTEFVNGHLSYRVNMPRILKHVGLPVFTDDFEFLVKKDRETEHKQEEQVRIAKERSEAEAKAKKRSGKKDVLDNLQNVQTSDSLSVMSRVTHDTPETLLEPKEADKYQAPRKSCESSRSSSSIGEASSARRGSISQSSTPAPPGTSYQRY